jgi:hypothetical protein
MVHNIYLNKLFELHGIKMGRMVGGAGDEFARRLVRAIKFGLGYNEIIQADATVVPPVPTIEPIVVDATVVSPSIKKVSDEVLTFEPVIDNTPPTPVIPILNIKQIENSIDLSVGGGFLLFDQDFTFTEVFNEIPKVGEHITEQQNKAKQLIKRIIERIPIYVTKTK